MFEPAIAKNSKSKALPFSIRERIAGIEDYDEIEHIDLLQTGSLKTKKPCGNRERQLR